MDKWIFQLGILDFPLAKTGDIYPTEVIEKCIATHKTKIEDRSIMGGLYDHIEYLRTTTKPPDLRKSQADLDFEVMTNRLNDRILRESFEEIGKEQYERTNTIYKRMLTTRARLCSISHVVVDSFIEDDMWKIEIEPIRTKRGIELEELLYANAEYIKQHGGNNPIIKFIPVLRIRNKNNGMIGSIDEIVSIDAYIRKEHGRSRDDSQRNQDG